MSTAQQTALNLKANLSSPTFTASLYSCTSLSFFLSFFLSLLYHLLLSLYHTPHSIEKYRRMICQTFVFNGQCPYGDRCVFLHDPRVAGQHPFVLETTKNVYKGHGHGVAKDTFYWPDMNRNDILKNVDFTSNGMNIPTCEQCYNIPRKWPIMAILTLILMRILIMIIFNLPRFTTSSLIDIHS